MDYYVAASQDRSNTKVTLTKLILTAKSSGGDERAPRNIGDTDTPARAGGGFGPYLKKKKETQGEVKEQGEGNQSGRDWGICGAWGRRGASDRARGKVQNKGGSKKGEKWG